MIHAVVLFFQSVMGGEVDDEKPLFVTCNFVPGDSSLPRTPVRSNHALLFAIRWD